MWIDDDLLERCDQTLAVSCWIPERPVVVMGSSNVAVTEAEVDACAAAGIPILRRYGGGGTVLLHSGCVVVSAGGWVSQHYQNKLYFERLNQAVIDTLRGKWPALGSLGQRGLSDIVAGEHKVAGTSLFRSRNYFLYQASILVEPKTELIAQFLKHPSKEPDYRKGRSHAAFVTGLGALVPGLTVAAAGELLRSGYAAQAQLSLGDELTEPKVAQMAPLRARALRGREA